MFDLLALFVWIRGSCYIAQKLKEVGYDSWMPKRGALWTGTCLVTAHFSDFHMGVIDIFQEQSTSSSKILSKLPSSFITQYLSRNIG